MNLQEVQSRAGVLDQLSADVEILKHGREWYSARGATVGNTCGVWLRMGVGMPLSAIGRDETG